ncbi:MAG: ATP-grasp domain-containing protein [Actinobacteria bacterium]|nr:ATP-grasp domain-containing protein [Actinomycetota bacterium]
MFSTVLVANRGEIARRVMRTCRRLGIRTVAVFSDADQDAPHVAEADTAVHIGAAPATDSYLDVDAIIDAAIRSGADAIHPGYGFLSENPALAEACDAKGIVFVGPPAEAVRLMGDKAAAKRHLEAAGVPVVPGVHGEVLDDEALRAATTEIGLPVLIKAVAGGGGKGMRAVRDAAELDAAVTAARREAQGAFGDDRLIVERLVDDPRHVEVQVLGDTHGTVVHVFERECSVQRRHQKVLEETPSPAVDPDLRQRMGQAAVTAAEAVGYVGAGTVEFLLAPDASFYFLEMNTRLQVEHPVTELVTGLDLVELQLRVAAGEPLPFAQDELEQRGHAIEARVYAEDAAAGFLPQTGDVLIARWPDGPDIRVDAGVETGGAVTRFYDPMLAKLVVHADSREAAVARLLSQLRSTTVLGVTTNLEFLADAVAHPAFGRGELTTSFIDDHLADWSPAPTPVAMLAAAARCAMQERTQATDPWETVGPWRASGLGGWHVWLRDRGERHELHVVGGLQRFDVTIDDDRHEVRVLHDVVAADGGRDLDLVVDGESAHLAVVTRRQQVWLHGLGLTRRLEVEPLTRHADPGRAAAGAAFTAPMPGAVAAVEIDAGDHVPAGATMMVVEAMKMEHPIKAPVAGTVTAIHVAVGDPVDGTTVLLEFEPDPEEET